MRQSMLLLRLVAVAAAVVAVAGRLTLPRFHYDAHKAVAWVNEQGCTESNITMCPGNRLCTDAEFFSRALAAGGALPGLDPNTPDQWPYIDYVNGTFNLCLSPGLISYLEAAGFSTMTGSENASYPIGAIGFTTMYPPGAPFLAIGSGRCTAHTPVVHDGPHCNVTCAYEIPRIAYVAPRHH